MTVYIEYAFLQNFLLDGCLLWLSERCAKLPSSWRRLLLAATVGGAYAVVAPFLALPLFWTQVLKWSVGLCLPLLAVGRVQTGREWRRYAWSVLFFFSLTFFFGGAILGVTKPRKGVAFSIVSLLFVVLTVATLLLREKAYQKRSVEQHTYACEVRCGEKRLRVRGFYDSGNLTSKRGLPVCFLSADVFYELFERAFLSESKGQVCDEIAVTTIAGEKKLPLYKAELLIKTGRGEPLRKEVYFARSTHMIGREYQLLLHSRILE